MEEVIKIVGSLNEWLSWTNLVVIVVLGWYIQGLYREVGTINERLLKCSNKSDRIAEKLVKLAKSVHGRGK